VALLRCKDVLFLEKPVWYICICWREVGQVKVYFFVVQRILENAAFAVLFLNIFQKINGEAIDKCRGEYIIRL